MFTSFSASGLTSITASPIVFTNWTGTPSEGGKAACQLDQVLRRQCLAQPGKPDKISERNGDGAGACCSVPAARWAYRLLRLQTSAAGPAEPVD